MHAIFSVARERIASPESEAAVPVQMELMRIIIGEIHEQQVIMLKEVDGDRSFSIMIGIFEATSIDRRVKHLPSPRPLTHDLVANVIENMGGELRDVYISELRDHTYYAKLRIRLNGEMVEVGNDTGSGSDEVPDSIPAGFREGFRSTNWPKSAKTLPESSARKTEPAVP